MSLARFALRTCTVHALRGATIVGANVRDSAITAVDIQADGALRTDEDRPFVVVYTDDSNAEGPALRDLHQNGPTDLVLEYGIALAMATTNAQGETVITGLSIPATDSGFEVTLDAIDRQVVAALTGDSSWANLWKRLSHSVIKIERRRAASAQDNVRMAARQLRLRLDLMPDPKPGQPLAPTSVWLEWVAALTAVDAESGALASSLLGSQGAELTSAMVRASRGHTTQETAALRYGPLYPAGESWTIQGHTVDQTVTMGGPLV